MARIGDFGKVPELVEPDVFGWFGVDVRTNPDFSAAILVDFWERVGDLTDEDPRSIGEVKNMMRMVVHAEDFDVFWNASKSGRATMDDFMGLIKAMAEVKAERPTRRSADSSAGPPPNVDESKVSFLHRVTAGRPDLEVGLVADLQARGQLDTG
jgi:hypothetical protein